MKLFVTLLFIAAGFAGWQLMKAVPQEPQFDSPRPATGRIVEAGESDLRLCHEKDERWLPAVASATEAKQRLEDAIYEHYGKEHGDFLQFKTARKQILADLEAAIVVLNELLESCSGSKSSQVEIKKVLLKAERLALDIKQDLRR
ncbi:MAG: hypothetical protein QGF46_00835 [Planctomycetota bacterium]|jgi:hypothetical protein|nr:hypothetical protein [Planctomycetota bacterium]